MDGGAVYHLPVHGRHLVVDERGIGLRATWHLERGFVNLSLWRDDRCAETFHLTPAEAGRLIGFLASGLAGAVPEPVGGSSAAVPAAPEPLTDEPATRRLSDRLEYLRCGLGDLLARAATRLRS